MKTMEIHNQAEYDANKDFDGILIIKSGYVRASGNATVRAWGNAAVIASDNATVKAWGNATVRASDNATVRAWGNAAVIASDNATVRAWGNAYCLLLSAYATFRGTMNATSKVCIKPTYDAAVIDFVADHEGSDLVLYKSVNPETDCDFRTGTIKYVIGKEVLCPDWDGNTSIECGNGLHLSPTALETQRYNEGKILKCLVRPEDVAVFAGDITKVRCRAVRPVAVVDRAGRVIK